MPPKYNLDKIKFATDASTFVKAVGLYENDKVTKFKEELNGFLATVRGTSPYEVYVDNRYYDQGRCDCYLGQNNVLCKHMVAVAIYAVLGGKKLIKEDKEIISRPACSSKLKELNNKAELAEIKISISSAIKYIKPYNGPSKIWFVYQNSLSEGCARLSKIVSELPVNPVTTDLLIKLLLRLDKKLCTGGVDDSDGTVGGFIEDVVLVLMEFVKLDSGCAKEFNKLKSVKTCFGWEEPLIKLIV